MECVGELLRFHHFDSLLIRALAVIFLQGGLAQADG
jgi:hypothetical protein